MFAHSQTPSKVTQWSSPPQSEVDNLRRENQQLKAELDALKRQQVQQIQRSKLATTGSLAAGLAHEINNPISFIYGNLAHAQQYSTLLLEVIAAYSDRLPMPDPALAAMLDEMDVEFIREDFPRLMESMRVGSKRIRGIVASLRTFANLDASHLKTVDLHRNLDSVLDLLNHRLLELGELPSQPQIDVVRHYRELPPVECYPGLINQVLFNVVNNAIDAIERRLLTLQNSMSFTGLNSDQIISSYGENLSAEIAEVFKGKLELMTAWDKDHNWIEVVIRDDGDGIAEGDRHRIFDPFFTTKPIGKGIGLGLTETHQVIVEHHRGQIELETAPTQGTTLTLKIPANHQLEF